MGWTVCLDLLIRSAIVICAGEALRRSLRRSHAAQRHRVLVFIFALLALLPLFSILLPTFRIPLWPSSGLRGIVTIQTTAFIVGQDSQPVSLARTVNWFLVVWVSGVLAAVFSLAAGRFVLARMVRRAVPASGDEWTVLLRQACSTLGLETVPDLMVLRNLTMPFAFGLRRPKILLPADCAEWTDLRKRIVLLHELAHIKRRDVATQLFANLIAALWWFQPLVWMTRRGLRRESERACDAQALSAGVRASEYAAELIQIARTVNHGRLWARAATNMARPGELESRLFGILDAQPLDSTRRRLLMPAAILTVLAMTVSAVTLSPQQKFQNSRQSGGLPMKRTLLPGLMASIGLSAATITGSIFDPSGASIYNAKVSLSSPDSAVKQDATSGADGKFTFDNLAAGQYFVRVEKPGFAALLREITVANDSKVERAFSMQTASTLPQAQVPGGSLQSTDPIRLRRGGEAMQEMLIDKVPPVYPPSAKAAGIQGTVQIEAVILKDGTPGELTVVSSPNDELSEASLEAVRQWRYSPTLLNGQPVEVVTRVVINFTLAK